MHASINFDGKPNLRNEEIHNPFAADDMLFAKSPSQYSVSDEQQKFRHVPFCRRFFLSVYGCKLGYL